MKIRLCADAADEAERIIGMCQRVWGLLDWRIDVRVVSEDEMTANEGKACYGAIRFHMQPRLATVLLLGDIEHRAGYTVLPIAFTVAHEVAHIIVDPLKHLLENLADTLSPDLKAEALAEGGTAAEVLCDTLARALVNQREVAVWDENDLPKGWEAAISPSLQSSPSMTVAKT